MSPYWTAPPLWQGETVFVLCGGTSVETQNLDLLHGRKVAVINSSCYTLPGADLLFFGDSRWWRENKDAVAKFAGMVVTVAPSAVGDNLKRMRKLAPPGLTEVRDALVMRRTSLVGMLNLLAHFAVAKVVLLGADCREGPDKRTHHHKPHAWPQRPDCWDEQRKDLQSIVAPLKAKGMTVFNASPGSALPFWPVMTLEEALCHLRCA